MKTETTFKEELEKELDKQFPKGLCGERSRALVLFAFAVILHNKYNKKTNGKR